MKYRIYSKTDESGNTQYAAEVYASSFLWFKDWQPLYIYSSMVGCALLGLSWYNGFESEEEFEESVKKCIDNILNINQEQEPEAILVKESEYGN